MPKRKTELDAGELRDVTGGVIPAGELDGEIRELDATATVTADPPDDQERELLVRMEVDGEVRELRAGDVYSREVEVDASTVDLEARTVEIAYASEVPVKRWFGYEILDHDPGAVRMERISSGMAPFLNNHGRVGVDPHLGVNMAGAARIDSDGVSRSKIKFSRRQEAMDVLRDIADGVRPGISVGYRIYSAVLVEAEDEGPDTYRITDWEPLETSTASVPAEPTKAGVGRAEELELAEETGRRAYEQPRLEEKEPIREEAMPPEIDVKEERSNARKAERERISHIRAMGKRFGAEQLAQEAIDSGQEREDFEAALLEVLAERGDERVVAHEEMQEKAKLGMSDNEIRSYSLYRAAEAAATGDWSEAGLEREVSKAVEDKLGKKSRGCFTPFDVLDFRETDPERLKKLERVIEYGNSASGATLVGTDHLGASFIDMLRTQTVLMAAGARVLSGLVGNVSIPRRATGAGVYWIDNESEDTTESTPTFDAVPLEPHTASAENKITRRMLLQSDPSVELLTRQDLALQIAVEVDRVGLAGTGTGAEPRGLLYTSGVNSFAVSVDGGPLTWQHVLEFETKVAETNGDQGNLAYMISPGMRGYFKGTEKVASSGRFIMEGNADLNGYPVGATNQLPTDLTKGTGTNLHGSAFGNWLELLLGYWGVLDLKADEITDGRRGGLILRAFFDMDVGVRTLGSFCVNLDGSPG